MKISEQQRFALYRIRNLIDELEKKRVLVGNFRMLNEAERILKLAIEHGNEKNFVEEYF